MKEKVRERGEFSPFENIIKMEKGGNIFYLPKTVTKSGKEKGYTISSYYYTKKRQEDEHIMLP